MINQDDLNKLEQLKYNLEAEQVKPKRGRKKTEDIVQELLDEHYRKIEELLKVELDHVSYRIYNSFKSEIRRQLRNG